ncbi:uncharacterized protein LOC118596745 [Onychomys torridus]|uniref:uncharacterized protein LOC118596745 n=1 Tax=Onychomys torridus TaxID=38674 RepID=UPI00167FD071|nr:uncharacterized protein LOC118596745 [Onychomys torridus]
MSCRSLPPPCGQRLASGSARRLTLPDSQARVGRPAASPGRPILAVPSTWDFSSGQSCTKISLSFNFQSPSPPHQAPASTLQVSSPSGFQLLRRVWFELSNPPIIALGSLLVGASRHSLGLGFRGPLQGLNMVSDCGAATGSSEGTAGAAGCPGWGAGASDSPRRPPPADPGYLPPDGPGRTSRLGRPPPLEVGSFRIDRKRLEKLKGLLFLY